MSGLTVDRIRQQIKRATVALLATVVALLLLISMLWRDRSELADVPLDPAPIAEAPGLTATWFGVATLLIDDGETQILIDGFISRPNIYDIVARRPVSNDAATINFFLNEYRVRRLAAIIPVHSHFDHAMDVGAIANRSSASILGSESTAQIGRGAGVPEDQIVVVENGAEYTFGNFTVRFIESAHAPVGWRGQTPLPGEIELPLKLPAPITAWREGTSYAVLISHPDGNTLVQGSAGIHRDSLDNLDVDTVFLGVGMVEGLGEDYLREYWNATVSSTGAKTVVPIHFEDYTQPFGSVRLPPDVLDNFVVTARRLTKLRDTWNADARLYLPSFGVPIPLGRVPAGSEDTTT